MKYLGERSLSSFLSKFFKVVYYLMLVGFSVMFTVFFIYQVFIVPGHAAAGGLENANCKDYWALMNKDFCEGMKHMPIPFKFLVMLYGATFGTLILLIVKKMQMLFSHFRQNRVFTRDNVNLINRIARYTIIISIMTFNINSFFIGLFLLILFEIFKSGTTLQEEHDYTV